MSSKDVKNVNPPLVIWIWFVKLHLGLKNITATLSFFQEDGLIYCSRQRDQTKIVK